MDKPRILVVEDEAIVALDLQLRLQRLGYDVPAVASSGEEALRVAAETRPALALMDVVLQGTMDGVEAATALRDRLGVPVVFLTAYADDATLQRAKVTEPLGYLIKPFEERELRSVLEMVLYKAEMTRRLQESERWLAVTLASIREGVIAVDPAGLIHLMNAEAESGTGWTQEEARGKHFSEILRLTDEKGEDPLPGLAAAALNGDGAVASVEATLFTPGERSVEVSMGPIRDDRQAVMGGVLVFRDVTGRKRAEEALHQSEARYRAVVEGSIQGIAIFQEGRIRYANPAYARMFGCAGADELIGQEWEPLAAPEDRMTLHQRIDACQRGEGPPTPASWQGNRKDGVRVWLESTACRFTWSGLPAVLMLVLDVTERKSLEEQFRQAQKMEAVGRLAGGVAHDFNNLLTIINGYSELMLSNAAPGDPSSELLREIRKAGERAAALTRQLLAFSRKQILAPMVLDLNVVVGDMENMLRRMIGEDVDLVLTLDPALERVKADRSQVEQVFLNLAVNARDAMPSGGRLTIETRNVELDEAYTRSNPEVRPGRYALLAVRDTGCGIAKEVQSRIFEPFFTTKEVGKGTGLGLATVYGIVKQSGGHIEVDSVPGRGTAFTIYLPRILEKATARGSHPRMPFPGGSETLLLVEDEEAVRGVARLVLQRTGYTVLEACDGREALSVAANHPGRIHLVVTDVVMPQMGGRELVQRLTEARPGLRALYLSGYTDDAVFRHGVVEAEMAFLPKPFTPAALARRVRELLDQDG